MGKQLASPWTPPFRWSLRIVIGICLSGLAAQAATLNTGDIIVCDSSSQQLLRIDPFTGSQTVLASGGLLNYPRGVAIEAGGTVLVANGTDGSVVRFDPKSDTLSPLSSGVLTSSASDITLDHQGNALVASGNGPSIVRIDPTSGDETILSFGGNLVSPTGIAVEASGAIVVADVDAHAIIRIDPANGAQTIVSSGDTSFIPLDVAINSNGDLVVLDLSFPTDLVRVDPTTGAQTVIASGGLLNGAASLALDLNDEILVAGLTSLNIPGIVRVDPQTAAQALVSGAGNLLQPLGVAVVPPLSCPPTPTAGCTAPAKSVLRVTHGARDTLTWKWLKGTAVTADFGDPVTSTDSRLCLYDNGALAWQAAVAAAGTCRGRPCWKPIADKGFRYRNRDGNSGGVSQILLREGTGKAKLVVKAKGSSFAPPALPLTVGSGVTAQILRNDSDLCWGSTFPTFKKNDAGHFIARAP